jgi:ADP-heptose:LPS heptosyltransferase
MERVLFISANRIGDAILSSGLLAELARRHPQARFTVACGPLPAPLFARHPQVVRVIPLRKEKRAGHWRKLWAQVVASRWDLVVDLRRSAMAWLLWTRRRKLAPLGRDGEHRVVSFARTCAFDPPPAPTVWTSADDRARAARLLPGEGPALAVAPTANWHGKIWPAERFAELVRRLTGAGGPLAGAQVLVAGGPGEAEQAGPVLDAVPAARRVQAFGLDLPVVAAALQRCRLFVGNDSGLMHLAAAAGTPTLGLFGPTDDRHYAPWGRQCRVVRTPESCRELLTRPGFDCATTPPLMTGLAVAPVERAARELLAATGTAFAAG